MLTVSAINFKQNYFNSKSSQKTMTKPLSFRGAESSKLGKMVEDIITVSPNTAGKGKELLETITTAPLDSLIELTKILKSKGIEDQKSFINNLNQILSREDESLFDSLLAKTGDAIKNDIKNNPSKAKSLMVELADWNKALPPTYEETLFTPAQLEKVREGLRNSWKYNVN